MTTQGPLLRYTCDRCQHSTLVNQGVKPDRWIGVCIQGGGRLQQVRNLCGDCTRDLDRLIFHRAPVEVGA